MKAQLKVLIILVVSAVVFVSYAIAPDELRCGRFTLKKLDLSELTTALKNRMDSTRQQQSSDEDRWATQVDTARQTVLFFGDSMTQGLAERLDDYCNENGHTLFTVVWNGSTTQRWAETNTLDTYLRRYRPTFIITCLGSNELFVRDLEKRDEYIRRIVDKTKGRSFVWIGPPNWKKDTGIDSLIRKNVGVGRYFDSSRLTFQRGKDHIHPTPSSSKQWMDSVAVWMSSVGKMAHPIRMDIPRNPFYAESYDIYPIDFDGFKNGDKPEKHRHYYNKNKILKK